MKKVDQTEKIIEMTSNINTLKWYIHYTKRFYELVRTYAYPKIKLKKGTFFVLYFSFVIYISSIFISDLIHIA